MMTGKFLEVKGRWLVGFSGNAGDEFVEILLNTDQIAYIKKHETPSGEEGEALIMPELGTLFVTKEEAMRIRAHLVSRSDRLADEMIREEIRKQSCI